MAGKEQQITFKESVFFFTESISFQLGDNLNVTSNLILISQLVTKSRVERKTIVTHTYF